jgi:hypothetical protein
MKVPNKAFPTHAVVLNFRGSHLSTQQTGTIIFAWKFEGVPNREAGSIASKAGSVFPNHFGPTIVL